MTIALMRIDNRLLHGQVAVSWSNNLGINTILIANDEVKKDRTKAMVYDLAKPANTKLYVRSVEESCDIVQKFRDSQKSHVLVIVSNLKDAYKLVTGSKDSIKHINIGGLNKGESKEKLSENIYLDQAEKDIIKDLENKSVKVEFRMLPHDNEKRLEDF